ncbi:hypothetical protein C4D60_Mb02t16050 [Musa balbisiana]|uniref:Membrane transporter protein n=1 Tax=Musa balbisiana TaxID=52838 RepID=A0A4S8IBY5_MUSBA|nr:hypothetical protein C4D60_Mb02t16050 [Musa balbisiana]
MEPKWRSGRLWSAVLVAVAAAAAVAADRGLRPEAVAAEAVEAEEVGLSDYLLKVVDFLWQSDGSSYQHVWPDMKFGWEIVVGSIIGFLGSAFGSVGGVGGGGIYVPMLTLIIGFDAKSSTAISKCMIMGAAGSTVWYNMKMRHPTLDMPIIDYDLALLFQPMLMLGISIGVIFNVVFADWMVTILLIILFIGTSTKAFLKGVETWKKETIMKKEAAMLKESNGREEVEYSALPSGPGSTSTKEKVALRREVHRQHHFQWHHIQQETNIIETNIAGSGVGECLLEGAWPSLLCVGVFPHPAGSEAKLHIDLFYVVLDSELSSGVVPCFGYITTITSFGSLWLNSIVTSIMPKTFQIPVSLGVSGYEAVSLYRGKRVISSKGDEGTNFTVLQLVLYCLIGVLAGVVGGLLGLGGGFILGPVFLELGVPPQVSSATATFAMTFSSSMSVVEYYLLKRFPIPYALYFIAVALVAAFVGQYVVKKLIDILGRASLIIFILAFTIFVSAVSLGGVGISNMVQKIQHHSYMGFENLCKYEV